jgi:hypothetical protein
MKRNCRQCTGPFEIAEGDLAFYDHVSPIIAGKKYPIPPPTLCPSCRLQRRLAFRNQTALFQRPAYPDGGTIFSMYPASAPFPVMRNEDWMGDSWDPLNYGQELSFDRPFLDQFRELHMRSPKYARVAVRNENCDYCNNLSDNKNCYMVFSISNAEDCMYCEDAWGSKGCMECTMTLQSEFCYDCTDCLRCYDVQSSEYSENCSESMFLAFCRNCKNCFGCANLRSKQYCIYNEQKTKAEYEAFVKAFKGQSWAQRTAERHKFDQFLLSQPRPHATLHQTENCTGNFVTQSRNVLESYFIQQGENLKHCFSLFEGSNDCMDFSYSGRRAELMYECCTCVINISHLLFCIQGRNTSSDLMYCITCEGCKDCFGCSGLKKKQYCILNRQYTKQEYETLVPKIITSMTKDGSWGEFFPAEMSVTPYNRSLAQRYFPLTKQQALARGLVWHEEDVREFADAIDASSLPDAHPAQAVPMVVRSAQSGQPFRITVQEIEQCIQRRVPLPRVSYEERMHARAKKLGGIRLYERSCAKTGKKMFTTYPPDAPCIIWERNEYERFFQ